MIAFAFIDESAVGRKRHPKPIAYDDIAVPSGQVITLTKANVRKCVGALVRLEGGPFRVRMDGGLPVSASSIITSSGYLRNDGDEYFCCKEEAVVFNAVLDINGLITAVEGMLRVTYYG